MTCNNLVARPTPHRRRAQNKWVWGVCKYNNYIFHFLFSLEPIILLKFLALTERDVAAYGGFEQERKKNYLNKHFTISKIHKHKNNSVYISAWGASPQYFFFLKNNLTTFSSHQVLLNRENIY